MGLNWAVIKQNNFTSQNVIFLLVSLFALYIEATIQKLLMATNVIINTINVNNAENLTSI